MKPQITNAANVAAAAGLCGSYLRGEAILLYQNRSIHLAIIGCYFRTIVSRSPPPKPFWANSCRISSRSPSGSTSMCRALRGQGVPVFYLGTRPQIIEAAIEKPSAIRLLRPK